MKMNKKLVAIIAVVSAAAGVGFFLYKRKQTASAVPKTNGLPASPTPSVSDENIKTTILAGIGDQYKQSVSGKLELMNDQELKDMLSLTRIQNSGLDASKFGAEANTRFQALKDKFTVFV